MKASVCAIAAAMLLGSVVSASVHDGAHMHAHLHEKRGEPAAAENASCECTTIWSTWYGQATLGQPASTETPSTSTHAAPTTSSLKPTSTVAAYVAHPAASSAHPKPSAQTESSGAISGGSRWAMAYSAYQGSSSSSTSCKSSSQVMEDIADIASKGFSSVRIYATDCQHLQNVGAACKAHGMKMIIGIYIDSSGISSDAYGQLSDIVSYFNGDYSLVEMALIGNEALFNGFVSAGELASFISHCKQTLQSAGYSGPVSTADTVASILANEGALCGSLDCLAANIHPYFNGNVQPSGACAFVEQQLEMLGAACGGKLPAYNSETGWPSQGPSYMNAVAGPSEQAAAIASLSSCSCAGKMSYLTYENDMWKDDGAPSVEPYWGVCQLFS